MQQAHPLNEIKAVTERIQRQNNGNWTFADIIKVKNLEKTVQNDPALATAEFQILRYSNNRNIAYQLNQKADIKVFLEDMGYKPKGSTQHWARYERGKNVLLVTDSNGYKDVKSGETGNLFQLIEKEYAKPQGMSQTEFFIQKVAANPTAEQSSTMHATWVQSKEKPEQQNVAPAVKKEFHLDDYRVEKLDVHKNYLLERGISKATLNDTIFKGAVLQGNRRFKIDANGNQEAVPRWQNNVIYPFKTLPDKGNDAMVSLLQQYGRKFPVGDKMVDKIFAPGNGKSQSAWFSNPPAKVDNLFVVENPLDAMSHYQLHKPENALYMATGGRPSAGQLQLIDEIAKKYNVPNKHLAFDNDMAGHSFDAHYLAAKTPQYAIKTVPNSNEKEFIVEYKQLPPAQYAALAAASKDKPNTKCKDDGSIEVRVATPEELQKCNKYAAKYLSEEKDLHFTKSKNKDFNDDLKMKMGWDTSKKKDTGLGLSK